MKFKKSSTKDLGRGRGKVFERKHGSKPSHRKFPLRADDEGLDFLAFALFKSRKDRRLRIDDDEEGSRYVP